MQYSRVDTTVRIRGADAVGDDDVREDLDVERAVDMYMCSSADRGTLMRSTLHGKSSSVTLNGVSHRCTFFGDNEHAG